VDLMSKGFFFLSEFSSMLQVRVRWREQRPPLEEETFRPLLYHYDGPKFRLELSKVEVSIISDGFFVNY
jgi:hypothetical protein